MVRRCLLENIEPIVAISTTILKLFFRNSPKALCSILSHLLEMMTFRDRTRVLEIELPSILCIKIGHQDFQGLVILSTVQGSLWIRKVHIFRLGQLSVRA